MSIGLMISSIAFLLFIIFFVLYLVRKRRISVKYSLVWLIPCLTLIIFTLVPGFLDIVTKTIGFKTASNMILTFLIGILMIITIALTVIVTNQKDKIRLLIQEVSIIKKEINRR